MKIEVLTPSMVKLGELVPEDCEQSERINSNHTLSFTSKLRSQNTSLIQADSLIRLDGDVYDIAFWRREQPSDGARYAYAECEHLSYRLNDPEFDVEYFTMLDSPREIARTIIEGRDDQNLIPTGFNLGTFELDGPMVTFSLQEGTSRRGLLRQFAAYIYGELEYGTGGRTINIVARRGGVTGRVLEQGRDILLIQQHSDSRKLDDDGLATVGYTVEVLHGGSIRLGDTVRVRYPSMGIDVVERVVGITRNPFRPFVTRLEIGRWDDSLEESLFRIETDMVAKGRKYYGIRISAAMGIEIIRNDDLARSIWNADVFTMQAKNIHGQWENRIYFDPEKRQYIFVGELGADVFVSQDVITNTIFAEYGAIADMTVNRLRTDYKKPFLYLEGNTEPVNYLDIYNEQIDFITASTDGTETEQFRTPKGEPIYWFHGVIGGKMTTVEESGRPAATEEQIEQGIEPDAEPVIVYVYDDKINPVVKQTERFETVQWTLDDGTELEAYMPVRYMGAGDDNGRTVARMVKYPTGWRLEYTPTDEAEGVYWLEVGDQGVRSYPPIEGGGGAGGITLEKWI